MTWLPERRTETRFSDFKEAYSIDQALTEANRCLYCYDAPCISKCPAAVDIPEFIRKIRTENFESAAETVLRKNILGMSCSRVCPVEVLCSGECVLSDMGIAPIQIGRLQRFVTDMALDRDWSFFERAPATGKKIALIGAGPASLSAAHELARLGHECVIFEKNTIPGGLNTRAIAPYKMKATRAIEEVEYLLRIGGIEVRYSTEAGKDITWQQLDQDFDAVFVGVGLGADRMMTRLPGSKMKGVFGAVDFIGQIKTSELDLESIHSAIVVGGGNTAVDMVRELLGLGVDEVSLVYRRDEASMPGYAHEWAVARNAGANAFWQCTPLAFLGDDRLEGVKVASLDEDLVPIEDDDFIIEADCCFIAIGQDRLGGMLSELPGITAESGHIVVDESCFTGRKGWFAGGDCVNGGKEVVNAAADGLTAATAIHESLKGE